MFTLLRWDLWTCYFIHFISVNLAKFILEDDLIVDETFKDVIEDELRMTYKFYVQVSFFSTFKATSGGSYVILSLQTCFASNISVYIYKIISVSDESQKIHFKKAAARNLISCFRAHNLNFAPVRPCRRSPKQTLLVILQRSTFCSEALINL